eukprot:scaffold9439_cov115-Cylindrotheca_fusiformis.AAC.3
MEKNSKISYHCNFAIQEKLLSFRTNEFDIDVFITTVTHYSLAYSFVPTTLSIFVGVQGGRVHNAWLH